MHLCEHHCHIAPVVAWGRVLLLVACIVLFVDDDQPKRRVGEEHCRAHSDNYARLRTLQKPFPYVDTLVVGELGVIYQQRVAKYALEPLGELGGKGYFGHQIEHLLAQTQSFGDEVHIDGSLAA